MNGGVAPAGVNLTGVWHGLYVYPHGHGSVSFVATLIETESWVSGSTHEPSLFGDCPSGTLFATLLGNRSGKAIAFVKTYEAPGYGRVEYAGTLNHDATEIEGRWTIPAVWSGRFLMIRSTSLAAMRARKASVRV
jgi:hypothetical protein